VKFSTVKTVLLLYGALRLKYDDLKFGFCDVVDLMMMIIFFQANVQIGQTPVPSGTAENY